MQERGAEGKVSAARLALISWAISALVVSVGSQPSPDPGKRRPGPEQRPEDGVDGPGSPGATGILEEVVTPARQ